MATVAHNALQVHVSFHTCALSQTMECTHMRERLIKPYFEFDLKYEETLKDSLKHGGLSHHRAYSDPAVLVEFIRNQLRYSGQLHRYRWMYAKCRENGLHVKKENVRLVLKEDGS